MLAEVPGSTLEPVATTELRRFLVGVRTLSPATDDSERIERIRLMEELTATLAAVQLEHAVEFAASQRSSQAALGVPAERRDRGIAAQLGLARRVSPWAASRWLGFARIVTTELPATFAELRAGRTTPWRAMLVTRETACLSREHRAQVDELLAPQLEQLGDRRVEAEAKAAAYRIDPQAAVARARNAVSDRRVSIRPAPDAMVWLGALLPVAQGVACHAALGREADRMIGVGENRDADDQPRTRGQVMADILVERLTGQASADGVPVEVELIMTDHALFDHGELRDEPAVVTGFGPVPAGIARDLVFAARRHDRADTPRWIRRLYQGPDLGALVSMDSQRRTFTSAQRQFLRLRDQSCRTPWCDAPVRHSDHVVAWADGGTTSVDNGQGYCAACNHAKQAPGWGTAHGRHADEILIVTPTDRRYLLRSPDLPGGRRRTIRRPLDEAA